MKISELKANQSGVELDLDVIDVGEVKTFIRFGKAIKVANAKVKDDSGETSLTLWNDEIDRIKPDMKLKLTNGYVKEFQGEISVTSGKFGKIEIVDGEGSDSEPEEAQLEEATQTDSEEN